MFIVVNEYLIVLNTNEGIAAAQVVVQQRRRQITGYKCGLRCHEKTAYQGTTTGMRFEFVEKPQIRRSNNEHE